MRWTLPTSALLLALSVLPGCAYKVGSHVKDVHLNNGQMVVMICDLEQVIVFGDVAEVRETNCREEMRGSGPAAQAVLPLH